MEPLSKIQLIESLFTVLEESRVLAIAQKASIFRSELYSVYFK